MGHSAVIDTPSAPKRPKVKATHRREQILALQLAGHTQEQIASLLGVNRKTVYRDLSDMQPSVDAVNDVLKRAQVKLQDVWPVEQRIERLANLGKDAKNEAVSLAAIGMGNDLDGIVTQKELVRTRRDDAATQVQPMFVLPANAHISVTVDTQDRLGTPPYIEERNVTPRDDQ